MSGKAKLNQVVTAIKKAMELTGCAGYEIKQADVLDADSSLTEWEIRKLGGLSGIKKKYFPVTELELAIIHKTKKDNSYVNKLEAQLGEKLHFENELIRIVSENLRPLPNIKNNAKPRKPTQQEREMVVMLNDTHFGAIIESSEIGGINNYGWKEACRRTSMLLQETLDYKLSHRKDVTKLHVVLNGDIIQGLIHNLNGRGMELTIHQINGAVHILTNFISNCANNFPKVIVTGLSGNHCDLPHKREHGKRVIQEKYDSFTNMIFYSLSAAFRNIKNVEFNFPKTLYAMIDLPAGRCLITHGDTLFTRSLGQPGNSINVKSLSEAIRKFNSGEIQKGNPAVKMVLLGHVHVYANFITDDGVEVMIAPSLSGTDGFAHSLNINNNLTGQIVFESTKKYILGDSRLVRVGDADNNKELDKLIPIFKNELKWQK